MDKEYTVLDIIDKNENITQREISKKANLSLGSVNLLLNKMAHDGLIKIKQIPLNRVVYMLTPKGMAEKVNKTYSYIKAHYNYINETKNRMKECLLRLKKEYGTVALIIEKDEISELLAAAAQEIKGIDMTDNISELKPGNTVITINNERLEALRDHGINAINLLEMI